MTRNILILYVFVISNFLHSAEILDNNEDENPNPHQQVVCIHSWRKFEFFSLFQAPSFWKKERFINPIPAHQLILFYPKSSLYNLPTQEAINAIVSKLSSPPIVDEVIELANSILSIYSLKNPRISGFSFDPGQSPDRNILSNAVFTSIKTLNTPELFSTKGYEWQFQSFIKNFSLIWIKLICQM